jgi:3-oxoacyl-[acyl-carrier protein] reductase
MAAAMAGLLAGKVAVVTGSTRGLGYAIAQLFLAEGAQVIVNGRSSEAVAGAVAALTAGDGRAVGIAGDVADPETAERLAQAAVTHFGRLDVWVNNAGTTVVADSDRLTPEDFHRVVAVDLEGAFFGSQAAARHMVHGGVILQMGSIFGVVGMRRRAAYVAAKHGLVGLTAVLADEWAPRGIRVLCLAPGYIATELAAPDAVTGDDYTEEVITRRTPLGRWGQPGDVAHLALFLASDHAGYMTGNTVVVDGGWTARGGW